MGCQTRASELSADWFRRNIRPEGVPVAPEQPSPSYTRVKSPIFATVLIDNPGEAFVEFGKGIREHRLELHQHQSLLWPG